MRFAFTLIEMLTTVAVLVIVLGLMVSLARDVRTRSADRLTTDLLRRLDDLVDQYRRSLPGSMRPQERRKYPLARQLFEAPAADEQGLRDNALANNQDVIKALRGQIDLSATAFNDLSIANYNEVEVLDAWGSPIVFMHAQHPSIGMAAEDRSFFFSAGPDRRYLTRQDNLYSYESGPRRGRELSGPFE